MRSDPEVASTIDLDGASVFLSRAAAVNSDGVVTVDWYGEDGINGCLVSAVDLEARRAMDSDVMNVVADLAPPVPLPVVRRARGWRAGRAAGGPLASAGQLPSE